MRLKTHLRRDITSSIKKREKDLEEERKALRALPKTDMRQADYIVFLRSHWAHEGEKHTTTEYPGSIEEAIRKAEKEFKRKNKRDDVQADYSVSIRISNMEYSLPSRFWEEYKEKY